MIMSPVDSFLNRKSKNAIANNAVAEAIERIEQDIERLEGLKASLTQSGSVQLSSASDVTDSTGMALPVTEKNPTIEGTLANEINKNKEEIKYCVKSPAIYSARTETLMCVGDHNFIHAAFELVPPVPTSSNFLYIVNKRDEQVLVVAAFPLDWYESRIFIFRHEHRDWAATEPLTVIA